MPRYPGIFALAAAAAPTYAPNAVVFDGTSDYLSHTSALTGAADSKLFTAAFALRPGSIGATQQIFRINGASDFEYFRITLTSTGAIEVRGRNTSAAQNLLIISSVTLSAGTIYAVLISCDMANTSNRHLYIDDVDRLGTVTTYGDSLINFDETNIGVGGTALGGNKLNGELADLWFETGRYTAFSTESNRRKFFSASNCLVNKGSDGSTPFSAVPHVFLSGATASWHTNDGGGGGFTLNGALGTAPVLPCGA